MCLEQLLEWFLCDLEKGKWLQTIWLLQSEFCVDRSQHACFINNKTKTFFTKKLLILQSRTGFRFISCWCKCRFRQSQEWDDFQTSNFSLFMFNIQIRLTLWCSQPHFCVFVFYHIVTIILLLRMILRRNAVHNIDVCAFLILYLWCIYHL